MTTPPVPVPATPDEVTGAWLNTCLGRDGTTAIRAVRVERIGAEHGLAGRLFRVRLESGTGPGSVIVKLWTFEHESGQREARVLAELGSRLGPRVPRCLHAGVDAAGGRGVLILEDLRNVVQGDCLDPVTVDDGVPLARSLAALHGRWHGAGSADIAWLPETGWLSLSREWLLRRHGEYASRFGAGLPSRFRRFLAGLPRLYGDAAARLRAATFTLLHDDVHLDNVVFDRATGEPFLLDWANAAVGPGLLDLAELLLAAEAAAVEPMLAAYRASLRRYGVDEADDAELAAAIAVCLVRNTYGIAVWEPDTSRRRSIIETQVARAIAAHRTWGDRLIAHLGSAA